MQVREKEDFEATENLEELKSEIQQLKEQKQNVERELKENE